MVVMAPADEHECQLMLSTGHKHNGPAAVRYPRGNAVGNNFAEIEETITIGKARTIQQGEKVAILSFGTLLGEAQIVADNLNATLVDMRFIKPIDEALIANLSESHDYLVTLEDNVIAGGAGSAVNEFILKNQKTLKFAI